jgi:hypothetical protein
MNSLTHKKAVAILSKSDSLVDLVEAVAFLADDYTTKSEELLPALDHPGIVADHAAIALHKMTAVPWGKKKQPITDRRFWLLCLEQIDDVRQHSPKKPHARRKKIASTA